MEATNETNDGDPLRVQTWDEYRGQRSLKARLSIQIEAANKEGRWLDHVLLIGPPGFGKTTLAQLIAREMDEPFKMLKMSSAMQPRVIETILRSWEGGVLFLDELHNASKAIQHELLTLLEDGYVTLKNGQRLKHGFLTVIGATTEPEMLLPPLRSRFRIRPAFENYTDAEMTEIIIDMARKVGIEIDSKLASELAHATGGTPRFAKSFVGAVRDLQAIGMEATLDAVLDLLAIDVDGLTYDHLSYLHALNDLGGLAGLEKLTNMTRLHPATIKELELLLIRRKLITYESTGRQLTQSGTRKVLGITSEPKRSKRGAA